MYRICWNKRPPRNRRPPKPEIFQRGEYTKPMDFDGWFFTGGSTQNRWALMGDFSKGGVHKTDGLWWVIFAKGGVHKNRWVLECFSLLLKIKLPGCLFRQIWSLSRFFMVYLLFMIYLFVIHYTFSIFYLFWHFFSTFECDYTQGGRYPHADQRWPSTRRRPSNRRGRAASCRQHCPPATEAAESARFPAQHNQRQPRCVCSNILGLPLGLRRYTLRLWLWISRRTRSFSAIESLPLFRLGFPASMHTINMWWLTVPCFLVGRLGLGISVGGGRHNQHVAGDNGIFITKIVEGEREYMPMVEV